ncbi:hypothetical protein NDU88_000476 [Pleurodeles waltl]|uniref:Uncharacterized protein n=1 Tax=Pleurodeles waltl TaxID=8319 RepID=A0AAV7TFZ5_PLEWA|nr:hypothetical protein NDU88_000476 [Pleurodeles waltl]
MAARTHKSSACGPESGILHHPVAPVLRGPRNVVTGVSWMGMCHGRGPLQRRPPIGSEEETLGDIILLGGYLRSLAPPQLVRPYVMTCSRHAGRRAGRPSHSWLEVSSGAIRRAR